MPEEHRLSVDERLEIVRIKLEALLNRSHENDARFNRLHEEVLRSDREWERFRRALRTGLRKYYETSEE